MQAWIGSDLNLHKWEQPEHTDISWESPDVQALLWSSSKSHTLEDEKSWQ